MIEKILLIKLNKSQFIAVLLLKQRNKNVFFIFIANKLTFFNQLNKRDNRNSESMTDGKKYFHNFVRSSYLQCLTWSNVKKML